ncbi:phage tail protein [Xanthobacter sp. KR7-225]|uniref:phage tail protein n=1 Tax=Xanthobacter sp. KR7-225 TaxID=3156613 RepID=UPI0032B5D805
MDRISGADWIDLGGGKRGFRGRDTGAGLRGTQVKAPWANGVQEELLTVIEAGGLVPTDAERDQVFQVLRKAIQEAGWQYAVAGGTADALTAALPIAPPALTAGLTVLLQIATTNTGPATLNLNALGAAEIRRRDLAQLTAGQLPAAGLVQLTYDGTYWQMLPLLTSAGSGLPLLPYVAATGGANALVADFDPPLTGLSAGLAVEVMVAVTNTAAATINCNSLGALAIKRPDGSALRGGDLVAGQVALLLYDGALWQLATPRPPRTEIIYEWAAGTANALTINPSPAVELVDGQMFMVHISQPTNTGPATLNVNGLGPVQILNRQLQPLVGGELVQGEMALIVYTAGPSFRLVSGARPRREVVYALAGGTANALTATPSPAVLSYYAGLMLMVQVASTNTGAATIDVSGLGAKAISYRDGNELAPGDLRGGEAVQLVYDGAAFRLLDGSRWRCETVLGYDVGAANAMVIHPYPSVPAHFAGQMFQVRVAADNTGPTTMAVSGLGAGYVHRSGLHLAAGDLRAGDHVLIVHNGVSFELLAAPRSRRDLIYAVAAGTANSVAVWPTPSVTAYSEGLALMVRVTADNTSSPTIDVSGLGAKAIWHRFGAALAPGELLAGEMAMLVYDGVRFIHVNGGRKRPGMPDLWTSPTPPPGAFERNGAAVSRTVFGKLFAAIGTTWGAGDGVNTFNIPDDRGLFDRGWDNGRGYDPGRGFGTEQADDFRSHAHAIYEPISQAALSTAAARTMTAALAGTSGAAGGSETRPRNRAYLPIIWY